MIPKIIHYCWFGRGEMPQLAKDCIASWHKYLPDWKYKLWNEDNFDINCCTYVKEAYEAKKYAFVTDYVRLYALYTEGGVYMDTDVEVLKPYDDALMSLDGFTGYEGSKYLPPVTGTMAAKKGSLWAKEQLDDYDGAHFLNQDGTLNMMTNTVRIKNKMIAGGFVPDGTLHTYLDMTVFPVDYFCPRQTTGEVLVNNNTYCDHHFVSSWDNKKKKSILNRIIGQKTYTRLIKIKRFLFDSSRYR